MNNQIFFWLYSFAHQSVWLDNLIIFCAVYLPYLVVMGAGLFLLFHHEVFKSESPMQVFLQKKGEILLAFFSGSLAWVLARLMKLCIHTSRPFDAFSDVQSLFPESGYAFPSGHATFYFALALSIYFSHKKAGYFFMALAFIISIARVAGGVHFPIDILGGIVLGKLVALAIEYLYPRFAYLRGKM